MRKILFVLGLLIATTAMALTVNGELKQARLENLASDPTAAVGKVYYNTVSNVPKFYNGTTWSDWTSSTTALSQYGVDVGNSSGARTVANTNLLGFSKAVIASFTFADGDVTTGTDNIAEVAHGMATGDTFYITTTGTVPTGLTASTRYFAIRVDADNFKPASTLALAVAGTAVNITAASGGGTHTVVYGGFGPTASTTRTPGTLTNDSAATGYVGETGSQARLRSAATSMTTATALNVTASPLVLTPGDYDIEGSCAYTFGATTSITLLQCAISTTSATLPATDTIGSFNTSGESYSMRGSAATVPVNDIVMSAGPRHQIKVAAGTTTTLYLVARSAFTVSTMTVSGVIHYRRVR